MLKEKCKLADVWFDTPPELIDHLVWEHSFPISFSQHVIRVYFRLVCTSASGVRPAVILSVSLGHKTRGLNIRENWIYLDVMTFDSK